MENTNYTNYLSLADYHKATSSLAQFTKSVLIAYDGCSNEKRDEIIRNIMARSITAMNGILHLWRARDYHDCWLLYRAILDRLFYLESIGRKDEFNLFDDWSFVKRINYKRKCLKDLSLVSKLDPKHFVISDQDRKRYNKIRKSQNKWTPPKPYEVASSMNLELLYSYGYDFASMYVHPSATEGNEDYCRLTGTPLNESFDDQITVIHNSFIITNLIISRGLFFSRLLWLSPVLKFVEDINRLIFTGIDGYTNALLVIKKLEYNKKTLCRVKD